MSQGAECFNTPILYNTLGYNKNLSLYLRTQYNPNKGKNWEKARKKIREDKRNWEQHINKPRHTK